jgi:hypothetical protein
MLFIFPDIVNRTVLGNVHSVGFFFVTLGNHG